MDELANLKKRAAAYREVLHNTTAYRQDWKVELRQTIFDQLRELVKEAELDATVEVKEGVENLEAVVLDLGQSKSGISEKVNDELHRPLIKHHGALVYQQLFNGKVIVLINYPVIEGYGQPRPPKNVAIYRPEELKPPFFIRHLEEFLKEVTNWEDYDDDEPQKSIGFNLNFSDTAEISGGN